MFMSFEIVIYCIICTRDESMKHVAHCVQTEQAGMHLLLKRGICYGA